MIGIKELDALIMQNIEIKNINNVVVNKYLENILRDKEFWASLFVNKYKISSNNGLNYEYIINFIHTG